MSARSEETYSTEMNTEIFFLEGRERKAQNQGWVAGGVSSLMLKCFECEHTNSQRHYPLRQGSLPSGVAQILSLCIIFMHTCMHAHPTPARNLPYCRNFQSIGQNTHTDPIFQLEKLALNVFFDCM